MEIELGVLTEPAVEIEPAVQGNSSISTADPNNTAGSISTASSISTAVILKSVILFLFYFNNSSGVGKKDSLFLPSVRECVFKCNLCR